MASLIASRAVEARLESQELRATSNALHRTTRANLATAYWRRRRAQAVAEATRHVRSSLVAPSPWSGLPWRRDDDALRTVLVPVD